MRLCFPNVAALKLLAAMTLCASIMSPIACRASSQPGAKISLISVDNNGGPYIFMGAGARTAKPACATDDFWAISNPATDNAKAMLANIMTAYALGKSVDIVGTGTCDSVHTTREKVNFIIML